MCVFPWLQVHKVVGAYMEVRAGSCVIQANVVSVSHILPSAFLTTSAQTLLCVLSSLSPPPSQTQFVERKVLPQHEHLAATGQLREQHRRDGFEAESARGIFASTTLAAAAAQKQGML